jgi:NAD(P)-dependent dehydrogenase (short-subunit alcohol dehydrogenase family)
MSSMNGKLALPMVGAYSASKFALEALSDSLRVELRPWKIPVSVIRPGQVRTAIFAKAHARLEQGLQEIPNELMAGYERQYRRAVLFNDRGARLGARPETVARVVLKALTSKRPKPCYTTGLDVRGLHLLQSILPTRWFDRLLARCSGATNRCERQASWSDSELPPLPSPSAAAPISPR